MLLRMIIGCPSCGTRFAIPDGALGTKGRTLKCARCGHKWFALPPDSADIAGQEAPAEAVADTGHDFADAPPPPAFPEADPDATGQVLPGFEDLLTLPTAAEDTKVLTRPAVATASADFQPEPIPASLVARKRAGDTADQPRRGGRLRRALVATAAVVLAGTAAAGGLFQFQEEVISFWPRAEAYYRDLGLRREVVGAGLKFRETRPELRVSGEGEEKKESLIVRGVIANVTDQPRDVPLLRIVLYDAAEQPLQTKVAKPPADGLDPGATVNFRIEVDSPDPRATHFDLTFTLPEQPLQ